MAASLSQKLQLKSSHQLGILNVPDDYVTKLRANLVGIPLSIPAKGKSDAVLAFVNSLAEAKKLFPRAITAVKPDGLLWIAYPKGGSKIKTDVNRDRLWEVTAKTGWRPVRLVVVDDVWSAMRFRPEQQVGK
jgi:hypothetical protein